MNQNDAIASRARIAEAGAVGVDGYFFEAAHGIEKDKKQKGQKKFQKNVGAKSEWAARFCKTQKIVVPSRPSLRRRLQQIFISVLDESFA
jgi:hypothetical protein